MIDAREIRIGNWIKGIALGMNHKVDVFFFHELYHHEESGDSSMLDYYSPIPLTPDILGKCGFVYDELYFSNGKYGIDPRFNTFFITGHFHNVEYGHDSNVPQIVYLSKCDSLHQLQNLYFSLTHTELEIKL
jgi:hypothetical protein